MKKSLLLFLIAQFCVLISFANDWEEVYHDDPQSTWNALHFVNDSVGYAGNELGEIYYTSDRGNSWHEIFNTSGSIQNFSFPNDTIAFASSDGYNPVTLSIDLRTNEVTEKVEMVINNVVAVHFVDDTKGVKISNTSSYRYLKRTSDGGDTWSVTKVVKAASSDEYFVDLAFATPDTGIALAQNRTLYRTTNGGTTWTEKQLMYGELRKAAFCNDSCGIIVGDDGVVWYSYDYGLKWYSKSIDTDLDLINVEVLNDSSYVVVTSGDDWKAFKSIDCGQTWNEISSLATTIPYPLSFELTAESAYLGYREGIMIKTDQDFASVDTLMGTKSIPALSKMSFMDKRTGWAVGDESLLYTKDGGKTWTSSEAITEKMYGVSAVNDSLIFAVGKSGSIFKSYDGGISWSQSQEGERPHNDVSFKGAFGVIVGYYGSILVSTDYGETWTDKTVDINDHLNDVEVVNDACAFAVGDDGYIVCTTDTGATWTVKEYGVSYYGFNRVSFVNELEGYATGENYSKNSFMFYRTLDGGQTWQSMSGDGIEKSDRYNLIDFASTGEGWIAGNQGIMHTTDTCNTWSHCNVRGVLDLQVVDSKNAFALASGNKIYRYTIPADSFNVSFKVSDDSGQHLDDVYLVIDADTLSLNVLSFRGEEQVEYHYSVLKEAYQASEGTLVLTKDTTIDIVLDKMLDASLSKPSRVALEASIYPNPSTDFVKISTTKAGFNAQVYTMTGQLLIKHVESANQATIDLQDLRPGMYLIKIQQNAYEITNKLIKN